jgi:hypothetical protein
MSTHPRPLRPKTGQYRFLVDVASSTDDALAALDQFLDLMWEIGLSKPIVPPTVLLQSSIVFEAEADLSRLVSNLNPIRLDR